MTTSHSGGVKRTYPHDEPSPVRLSQNNTNSPPSSSASATSAFRNVSACNRCRVRKNRCDQQLPACNACEKAGVKCVGYDPITKREIPRSYVFYLETRLAYFESLLRQHGVPFNPPEAYGPESRFGHDALQSPKRDMDEFGGSPKSPDHTLDKKHDDADKLDKLVSNIGMVSVHGASDPRYLGSTSGISFARVVFAAVKSSVSTNNSERTGVRPSKPTVANSAGSDGSTMRDSYFGLQTKPTIKQAPFPDRQLGEKLVNLYFENANPQIPILHRPDFMELFERAYSDEGRVRTPRELYMLNIVFAIGSGIIFGSSDPEPDSVQHSQYKRPKLASHQCQPEEYHASAIVHLEFFLGSSNSSDKSDGFGGGLEELQAVLLLAGFALLRPVAPGLWYIIGVAVRLAVDLGLHYEDGSGIASANSLEQLPSSNRDVAMEASPESTGATNGIDAKERGRREWIRDLRRRLWWCVYNFDRLVSTCVGRPFGISDQVITTEFPSLLDDKYITRAGFLQPPSEHWPSYKYVAHHYFRLRLLQSEILNVLQYQQAQQARRAGAAIHNEFMHTRLPSPFLLQFASFKSWRKDIDRRLWEWKESAPDQQETGVQFAVQFLELNYWQAVTMLYRQSLSVPAPLASETSPTKDVESPASPRVEDKEDEDEVYLKCAEAGQKTLKLYRQLHRLKVVNYTYLATHHLFMAGISFLYAVWHSPAVRARLTLDDVDFTILAATSVLDDLMTKCPPAEACRDAFQRMSRATVSMVMSSTHGFGVGRDDKPAPRTRPSYASMGSDNPSVPIDPYMKAEPTPPAQRRPKRRPPPKFDDDLRQLFSEETFDTADLTSQSFPQSLFNLQPRPEQQYMSKDTVTKSPTSANQPSSPQAAVQHSPINAQLSSSGFDLTPAQTMASAVYPPLQPQQSVPFYNTSNFGSEFVGIPGMDFLNTSSNDDEYFIDASGLDLGFGMNMDFQHDFNDGQPMDLFEGFFFGNP